MIISAINILVVIAIIYLLFRTRGLVCQLLIGLFEIELIFAGLVNIGSFCDIGSFTISISDFLQIIQLPLSVIVLAVYSKEACKKRDALILFTLAVIASLAMIYLFPYGEAVRTFNAGDRYGADSYQYYHYVSIDTQVIKTSVRFICFAFNACAVSMIIDNKGWEKIKKRWFGIGCVMIAFCWFEFLTVNFIGSNILDGFYRFLFGSVPNHSIIRNGLHVLCGFTNEPSQLSMVCFDLLLIYIIGNGREYVNNWQHWLILSGFAIPILGGSFRFVGLFPILLAVYMAKSKSSGKKLLLIIALCLGCAIAYYFGAADYIINRLSGVFGFLKTGQVNIYNGESGRLKTITDALEVFVHRPIFGIGPGTTFAYGFIPSILVMLGFGGTLAWYNLFFREIGGRRCFINKRLRGILLIISFAWIYTNAISTGYAVTTLALALELAFPSRSYEEIV